MKNINFIKDPIYGEISFSESEKWIVELINTNEFKRLKNIVQLGTCHFAFPSATHNRFTHSLGAFYLTRLFIQNIKSSKEINDETYNAILTAGLLHDIGHGPSSHSFELYMNDNFHHEDMTIRMIENKEGQIYPILKKYNINIELIIQIIQNKTDEPWKYQIVSSGIDADRLDYLMRDSYFSGVIYGKVDHSIIMKWILVKNNQICFDKKAYNVVENVLYSRITMFKQIYLHKLGVLKETLIIKLFKRIYDLNKIDFNFKDEKKLMYLLEPFLNDEIEKWDINLYLEFTDITLNLLIQSISKEDDSILKKLSNSYINDSEFELIPIKKNKEKNKELLKAIINDFGKKITDEEIKYYFDTIYSVKTLYSSKKDNIMIFNESDDSLKPITEYSDILKKLDNDEFAIDNIFCLKK